jgi:pimeloyl-ACP methyl ester carboxylesterase
MNTHSRGSDSRTFTDLRLTRRQALARGGAGLAAGALIASRISVPAQAQTASPNAIPDDFAGSIDIGGRMLYVESAGSGRPTVVLEAGLLGRSDVWSRDLQEPEGIRQMVFPAVAEFSHVFTYDRPGTIGEVNESLEPDGPLFYPSRSDPVPMPRTIMDIAGDLAAVLELSGQTGPYVLVGHSMGGLSMKYFAMTHPDEVVGLVLVDATHEDVWDHFRAVLPPDQWEQFEQGTVENTELLAAYPDAERVWTDPLADDPSVAEIRRARTRTPLKPMPLVVLSHGIPFAAPYPGWLTTEMEQVMTNDQRRQAELVPNAKHIIAEQSGHDIHQDQPEFVIEAIRMVVNAVRDPATWSN